MEYENQVLRGACLDNLRELPDNIFDAIVMDPPYGLGSKEPSLEQIIAYLQGADLDTGGDFMGQKWSIPSVLVWRELFRVLKPGGYVATFGGTRTWDLISLGARVVGFEYRDTLPDIFPDMPGIFWMHGQGFPKSLNVSKAFDKEAGAEREVIGTYRVGGNALTPTKDKGGTFVTGAPNSPPGDLTITAPATDEAKEWDGYGTALKPSWEPILLFRKPLDGTVLENIRKWGTGALNIGGCRVGSDNRQYSLKEPAENLNTLVRTEGNDSEDAKGLGAYGVGAKQQQGALVSVSGRWPPNTVFVHNPECRQVSEDRWECVDGCPAHALDVMTGDRPSTLTGRADPSAQHTNPGDNGGASWFGGGNSQVYADNGGASRFFPQFTPFFYTGKATKKEATLDKQIKNNHPTKKPLKLMQWIVRLTTPKNGLVLDPYCGSGTTLHAAIEEKMRFTGIERDHEFCETARQRMEIVLGEAQVRQSQEDIFDLAYEMGLD